MRTNRGISRDVEGEGKCLKKGQSVFWKKGDVMVQVWMDKRLVQMISMIEVTIVYTGRKDGKTNLEKKKPYAVIQYCTVCRGALITFSTKPRPPG
jgi:hypothetical protein